MEIQILLALAAVSLSSVMVFRLESGPGITADEALKRLLDGNRNFMANRLTVEEFSGLAARRVVASGQKPYAIILACSDSRVPPEIIFDKGLGEIFVVRVAGNIVDPIVLGSIEYAAQNFGSPLILVLGHSRCGAVTASVQAKGRPEGNIGAIVEKITPAVIKAREEAMGVEGADLVELAINHNIELVAKSLVDQSPVIRSLAGEGKLKIVGAKYDLDHGSVAILSE